tara:strand:- start:15297 stop:16244 length:948 start_codon:yes stop_codon:yes gene_type:complete
MNSKLQFKIVSFYQFVNLKDIKNYQKLIYNFCSKNKLRGTIILSNEGINGTIAGIPNKIDEFIKYLDNLHFSKLNIKESYSLNMPFYRLKIKVKKEIVTMLNESIDSNMPRGKHLNSEEWNNLINNKDVLVLDVRNKYETDIGYFDNAVIPNSDNFVEFKKFIDNKLSDKKNKKIAMYCTGGIRCEKASYYMKKIGFKHIYQLNGGILKYLEGTPSNESKWNGECFVFDNRVSLNHSLNQGNYELCRGCNNPLPKEETLLEGYEKDVSCSKCYKNSSERKKNNFRERSKQVQLAKQRNKSYIYDNLNYDQYIKEN